MGRVEESEKYRMEAERARQMMPQFQLEGLWVGKYVLILGGGVFCASLSLTFPLARSSDMAHMASR